MGLSSGGTRVSRLVIISPNRKKGFIVNPRYGLPGGAETVTERKRRKTKRDNIVVGISQEVKIRRPEDGCPHESVDYEARTKKRG